MIEATNSVACSKLDQDEGALSSSNGRPKIPSSAAIQMNWSASRHPARNRRSSGERNRRLRKGRGGIDEGVISPLLLPPSPLQINPLGIQFFSQDAQFFCRGRLCKSQFGGHLELPSGVGLRLLGGLAGVQGGQS